MIFRKKIKRSTKQYLIVAFICITVIGSAAIFTSIILANQIKDEYEAKLKLAYDEMAINQRDIYVATLDIMAGDRITSDNIVVKRVYASQPTEIYFMLEKEGNIALVDIPKDTQITKTMTTENQVSSEIREVQYDVINISSNVYNNDTIDIRITYPNGESYIVLSKKHIRGLLPETLDCLLWLDEEEILRMSAAIVDAGLYSGSTLTVTKYLEPSIQEGTIVNYVPSLSIITLMENNPNIVGLCSQKLNRELRKALENRLAISMDIDVSTIMWDVYPNLEKDNYQKKEEFSGDETNEELVVMEQEDYNYYSLEDQEKEGEVELGE
ncbi:MAG: hypothetical protein GX915_02835 [Clostridiales bacterium]|nr:hypothetical protein [Clostridiales bacterium]